MEVDTYAATVGFEQAPFYLFSANPQQATRAYTQTSQSTEPATRRSEDERQDLILAHTSLVEYVARRLGSSFPASLSRQDLLGYGTIGLIEAVDRFDPSVGVKFETFAVRRIWGSMVDAMREQGFLPRNTARRVREMNEAAAALEQELSRAPTTVEVARNLGTDTRSVEETLCAAQIGMVSLDTTIGDNGDGDSITLRDVLADDSEEPSTQLEEAEQVRVLTQEIDELPERERLVVSLYYHEELTLKEIGRVLGISESRACQLHTTAVQRLRAAMALDEHGKSPRGRRAAASRGGRA